MQSCNNLIQWPQHLPPLFNYPGHLFISWSISVKGLQSAAVHRWSPLWCLSLLMWIWGVWDLVCLPVSVADGPAGLHPDDPPGQTLRQRWRSVLPYEELLRGPSDPWPLTFNLCTITGGHSGQYMASAFQRECQGKWKVRSRCRRIWLRSKGAVSLQLYIRESTANIYFFVSHCISYVLFDCKRNDSSLM